MSSDRTKTIVKHRRIFTRPPSDSGDIPSIYLGGINRAEGYFDSFWVNEPDDEESQLDQMRRWIEEHDGYDIKPFRDGVEVGFSFKQQYSRTPAPVSAETNAA